MPSLAARAVLLLLVVSWATALASDPPLDLEHANARALVVASEIATRQAELEAARRDAQRAALDPLASTLDRLQADHGLASAEATLAAAERAAVRGAFDAYTGVLERLNAMREASARAEIAAAQTAAATVRYEAGVITALALEEARSTAEAARRAERDAATALDGAWIDLAAQIGLEVSALRAAGVVPLEAALPAEPDVDADLERLGTMHVGIAAAERSVALAHIRLQGTDHLGSSPNAVADARAALASAVRRFEDAEQGAAQQLRNAFQSLLVAYGRFEDAVVADAAAAATFEAQRIRNEAGELAPIAWLQARLDRDRGEASMHAALHVAYAAWLRYQQVLHGH